MIKTALRTVIGRKGTGYLASPPDARDIVRGVVLGAAALPEKAMTMAARVVLRDQGATQSCTQHAIDYAKQALGGHKGDTSKRSVQYGYYNGRSYTGMQRDDGGAILRDVLRADSKLGAPPDADAPLRWTTVNRQPSALAYRDGMPWRGLRYSAIVGTNDQRLHAVRDALAHGHPVVGGWQVDQAFIDGDGDHVATVCGGRSVGGHAMAITGYDGGYYRVPNSWGAAWRDHGSVWFGAGAVVEAMELWVLEGWT